MHQAILEKKEEMLGVYMRAIIEIGNSQTGKRGRADEPLSMCLQRVQGHGFDRVVSYDKIE